MITYLLEGHDFRNEVQTMIQVFYPNQKYKEGAAVCPEGITVRSRLEKDCSTAEVYENGVLVQSATAPCPHKQQIKRPIYEALRALTGYDPPWGMLTGIRPAKKMNELLRTMSEADALAYFGQEFDTKPEKARLALSVAKTEQSVLAGSGAKAASLYIGIPFCPTRCLYCSFASYPLGRYQKRVADYLEALHQELRYLSGLVRDWDLHTIYIGGGTPTALDEASFDALLQWVAELFPVAGVTEFTVEAGRPDTITFNKLKSMKAHGVSRISINPQTMNDETLALVGREHSAADIKAAFAMAREAGHTNINMDLILGLPGEGAAHVARTMEAVAALSPESVTVHTLAVKRASRLNETFAEYTLPPAPVMEQMLHLAQSRAEEMGMRPYYLYRQKNMVGSFENVGYARPGCESPYNILIMEETQTIFAAGCGAVTKVVEGDRIDRVFNVKSLEDYIGRIDEMIARKKTRFGR